MSFLELCRKRQSEREYDASRPVPREALERCLEAARLAPSACNSQPWEFVIAHRPELRKQIADTFSGPYFFNAFVRQAGALVALVRRKPRLITFIGGLWRGTYFPWTDLGIAGEHFVLQAADEGLGTCWIGWFNEGAIQRLLGLKRRHKIECLIAVGWPVAAIREKKRKPSEDTGRIL